MHAERVDLGWPGCILRYYDREEPNTEFERVCPIRTGQSDVAIGMRSGAFPHLSLLGIDTGEGVARVAATCLLGLGVQAVAAALLYIAAVRSLDATVRRADNPG